MEDLTDITDTLAPKSDQLNAEDLLTGSAIVTVTRVTRGGSPEQPVDVHLAEYPGRPWRPCKTMRRLVSFAWGKDPRVWVGRQLELYRDDSVRFGGDAVGGIRVAAMSHLERPLAPVLATTRGKRAPVKVGVLQARTEQSAPSMEDVLAGAGLDVAAWDAYAAANDRTAYDVMSPRQRAACARWLQGEGLALVQAHGGGQ